MNTLYPLKFKPVFKDKIWGGEKIRTVLGMDFSPLPNCGEAWVLSGVNGSETLVSNGFLEGNSINDLLEVYMDELVGETVFDQYPQEFPLLIKFIDSNDYLSVQVHPDDALAAKKQIGNGKTEMWYVLDAGKDAKLFAGFNRELTQKTYLDYLEQNRIEEVLNTEKVEKDDVFFIPAGTIHALGPGVLLAEIQQSSDTTYRVYDWNRKDEQGRSRDLHKQEALEALDFSHRGSSRVHHHSSINKTSTLIHDAHFSVTHLEFDQPMMKDYSTMDSFIILLCLDGAARITSESDPVEIKKGECILIPAIMNEISLYPEGKCKLLEVYI